MVKLGYFNSDQDGDFEFNDQEAQDKIIFSLVKCTGNCDYFCASTNSPTLQSSNCSSGCGCPTLDPITSQCAGGTAFSLGCV